MAEIVEVLSLSSLVAGTLEYAILMRHRAERRQETSWRQAAEVTGRQALTRLDPLDTKGTTRRWSDDGSRFRLEKDSSDPTHH
jgi:hypothetical protein